MSLQNIFICTSLITTPFCFNTSVLKQDTYMYERSVITMYSVQNTLSLCMRTIFITFWLLVNLGRVGTSFLKSQYFNFVYSTLLRYLVNSNVRITQKNCFSFQDSVSLCNSPSYPGTHFVDQAGLEHRELPATASARIKGISQHHLANKFFYFRKT